MPLLIDLPNEILLQIISNIDSHREDRILGYDPDGPPPLLSELYLVRDFVESNTALCRFARTCKRISLLVPEHLIFAPVLALFEGRYSGYRLGKPRILSFLHVLTEHPERSRCVKRLRLSFPTVQDDHVQHDEDGPLEVRLSREDYKNLRNIINLLDVPSTINIALVEVLGHYPRLLLSAILLLLMPQLEVLCISGVDVSLFITEQSGPPCLFDIIPFRALRYVKIENRSCMSMFHITQCVKIQTLDLSIVCPDLEDAEVFKDVVHDPRMKQANQKKPNHLRLDYQTKTVGIWDHDIREYMKCLLENFRHLKSLDFYAESSNCKNPYRSVRAFPHNQTEIQDYPDPSEYSLTQTEVPAWDHRIYDARTEVTNYQMLIDSIAHLRPCLEALRLPGGFWTLPGGTRKPLPRFNKFEKLMNLAVPQAAIITIKLDSMHFNDVVGDFDLSPTVVLPPSLQHLEIFDAEASLLESKWLLDFFGSQLAHKTWPAFECLDIRFGYTVDDDELERIVARKSLSHRNIDLLAKSAQFKFILGRDDALPFMAYP